LVARAPPIILLVALRIRLRATHGLFARLPCLRARGGCRSIGAARGVCWNIGSSDIAGIGVSRNIGTTNTDDLTIPNCFVGLDPAVIHPLGVWVASSVARAPAGVLLVALRVRVRAALGKCARRPVFRAREPNLLAIPNCLVRLDPSIIHRPLTVWVASLVARAPTIILLVALRAWLRTALGICARRPILRARAVLVLGFCIFDGIR